MHNLLNLDSQLTYSIEDVDRIRKNEKFYQVRVVLSTLKEGRTILYYRYTNIQFAKQLHIAKRLTGARSELPEQTVISLPKEILRGKVRFVQSIKCLDQKHIVNGVFSYNLKEENRKNEDLSIRLCKYEFAKPIRIGDRDIRFLCISSFEIARYFLFGTDLYNEALLTTKFSEDKKNKIYNPNETAKIEVDGNTIYKLRLRSKIPDDCTQMAGDLAFIPEFKNLAESLIGVLRSETNYFTFYNMKLPITKFDLLEVMGEYVVGSNGAAGFWVKTIYDAAGYGPVYYYDRDNDGRTTQAKHAGLPKIFGGKKPAKQRNPQNIPPIDPNASGDPDLETTSLTSYMDDQFVLPKQGALNVKLMKFTQENQAGQKTPQGDVDSKAAAGQSDNEGKGSGVVRVSNDMGIPALGIDQPIYWEYFEMIIKNIQTELIGYRISIAYLNSSFKFQSSIASSNYSELKIENFPLVEFYLVKLVVESKVFYIMELDLRTYMRATLLFWDASEYVDIPDEMLREFLKHYNDLNGVGKSLSELYENESFKLGAVNFRHQTEKWKGEPREQAIIKALGHQAKKIANEIKRKV